MYCEKCCRIIDTPACPFCKKSTVREPEPKDACFLTELDYLPSSILEDLLAQNGIPFLKKGVLGAGLSIRVGPMLDRSRFYVPYDTLESARSVADDLLSGLEEGEAQAAEEE